MAPPSHTPPAPEGSGPTPDFWATVVWTRVPPPSEEWIVAGRYQPDLAYDAEPRLHWIIWPVTIAEDGAIGFECLSRELWESVHRPHFVPGLAFTLWQGSLVGRGTVVCVPSVAPDGNSGG